MWFTKKKKNDPLVRSALREISKITYNRKSPQDSFGALNRIIRIFLKERFKIPLSDTTKEALARIKRKKILKEDKISLSHFLITLHHEEYLNQEKPSKKQFTQIGKEMRSIIRTIG